MRVSEHRKWCDRKKAREEAAVAKRNRWPWNLCKWPGFRRSSANPAHPIFISPGLCAGDADCNQPRASQKNKQKLGKLRKQITGKDAAVLEKIAEKNTELNILETGEKVGYAMKP